ncbi:hypothetical protein [Gloeocapsa sp. PCC 73106]|uniref:hypothetical protein n=1 Tax=Gloeocapsa sp. PCC 73106 TaxID=102232 RepID=UPI0002ABE9C7|nr:hypothetical protein [Gloeocapsa sp. PCC 73106]ELR97388.1 hypothetical protein GLO73106DRAFT_00011970 [Gloeocapsa sp. PCC 73106]
MKLEQESSEELSPFYHGLLWGLIVSLTITVSVSVGAASTFVFPSWFEAIESIALRASLNVNKNHYEN